MKKSLMRALALALGLTLGGTALANAANAPDTGKTVVNSSKQVVSPSPTVAHTPAKASAQPARGWAASSTPSKPINGPALAKRVEQGPQPQIVPFSL